MSTPNHHTALGHGSSLKLSSSGNPQGSEAGAAEYDDAVDDIGTDPSALHGGDEEETMGLVAGEQSDQDANGDDDSGAHPEEAEAAEAEALFPVSPVLERTPIALRWCLPSSGMFVSMLANHTFFVGSIFWILGPTLLWIALYRPPPSASSDSSALPLQPEGVIEIGDLLTLVAGLHFVLGGPIYLYDWYRTRREGIPPIYAYGAGGSRFMRLVERQNWMLFSLLFFHFGSLADVSKSILAIWWPQYDVIISVADLVSANCWSISGAMEVLNWYLDLRSRTRHAAPLQKRMWPRSLGEFVRPVRGPIRSTLSETIALEKQGEETEDGEDTHDFTNGKQAHCALDMVEVETDSSNDDKKQEETTKDDVNLLHSSHVYYVYDYQGLGVCFGFPAGLFYLLGAVMGFFTQADLYQLVEVLAGVFYQINSIAVYGTLWIEYRYPALCSRHCDIAERASL